MVTLVNLVSLINLLTLVTLVSWSPSSLQCPKSQTSINLVVATRLLLGWKQKRLAFFITPTLLHPCYILLYRHHPTLYTLLLSRYTLLHPDYTLLCPVTPCYTLLHSVMPR